MDRKHLRLIRDRQDRQDHAEWTMWHERHGLVAGKQAMSIADILRAKKTADVRALPALLNHRADLTEKGAEAIEAVNVIIAKNPGNQQILGLVPALIEGTASPGEVFDSLILFSSIAQANPDAEECKRHVPELIECLKRLIDADYCADVLLSIEEIAVIMKTLDATEALPHMQRALTCDKCDPGSDMENSLNEAIEKLQR
jgi:ribosome-associated translation inhibitor RaiA